MKVSTRRFELKVGALQAGASDTELVLAVTAPACHGETSPPCVVVAPAAVRAAPTTDRHPVRPVGPAGPLARKEVYRADNVPRRF